MKRDRNSCISHLSYINCIESTGKVEKKEPEEEKTPETEAQKKEEALKTELELKNIKSELNLSDHTQIIKYEHNQGGCKLEGT